MAHPRTSGDEIVQREPEMIRLDRPLVLASSSPRRQFLMKEAGFPITIAIPEVDEQFPPEMAVHDVARYLASRKADYFRRRLGNEIVIAADTVVILDGNILNKPADRDEAVRMLASLSGRTHRVVTGVCILSKERERTFDDTTDVTFRKLTDDEIGFYVDRYAPFDKAGGYGAQDWIGMVGVERISGSYFNVMGMPMHKVYEHLLEWTGTP